jgi:hypothetical protein
VTRHFASADIEELYTDGKHDEARIKMLNAQAAFSIKLATSEKETSKREELNRQAIGFFNKADSIDQMFDATWVGKGTNS